MSWIFHQPFEAALYARRRVAPARAFAPGCNRAGRVLASLLAVGAFDAFALDHRRPAFPSGHPTPGPDGGRSAAVTLSATGAAPPPSIVFGGQGDDPYRNDALAAGAGQGLLALGLEALAVEERATFGGASASREV